VEVTIMKKSNCKTSYSRKNRMLSLIVAALSFLFLNSGCATSSSVDRWKSELAEEIGQQRTISGKDLQKILMFNFGLRKVFLTDQIYILPDNDKVSELQQKQFPHCTRSISTSKAIHSHSGWDHDDYAAAAVVPMRNYAFGTMYIENTNGTMHAINVFVNSKHEVWYWEAQTCQYSSERLHSPKMVIF